MARIGVCDDDTEEEEEEEAEELCFDWW